MRYILTEDEYEELHLNHKKETEKLQAIINDLCIDVANYKPTFKDEDNTDVLIPWECIHSVTLEHYCDECSVRKYCKLSKNYSK